MFPVGSDRIPIRGKLDPKIFLLRTGALPSRFSFQFSGFAFDLNAKRSK
jgi:hypothetical protein